MKRAIDAEFPDENTSIGNDPPLAKKTKVDGIPAEALEAQKKFVQDAIAFTKTGTGVDVIKDYLEKNSSCNDILLLLYQGASHSEASAIFNSLEVILLRITEDLNNFISSAIDVIHRLLANFSRLITRNLAFTNTSTEIKSSLKLLSAMATVSRETANDVFNVINFSRRADLLKRINSKDPQDVRACFINLMLAFLMSDSAALITRVIKLPEFALIFQDLYGDKEIVIEVFLNTVTTKVVYNTAISKTAKVSLFGESTLKHLIKLLTWEGPKKYKRKKKSTAIVIDANTDGNDKELDESCLTIRNLALKFLLVVCSHKYGILFKDDTMGTSEKNRNPVISSMLHNFQYDTVGNELKEEFVITVLKSCPDQLVTYLYLLEDSIAPRPSEKWIKLLAFINKIYYAQDPLQVFAIVSKSPDVIPMKSVVSMTLNSLLPPLKICQILTTAIQDSHLVVKREGLTYMLKALKRMKRVMVPCEECLIGQNNILTPAQAEEYIKGLKLQLAKILPTFETLIYVWEYFMGYNDTVVNANKSSKKNWCANSVDEQILHDDCRVVLGEDLMLVLDMCTMIGKFMPSSAMDQLVFSIKKMLTSIDDCQSWADVSEKCLVQLRFLRLMNDLNFWKTSVIEKGNTCLELFVDILTNCSTSNQHETIQMMKSFLLASPLLHDHCDEIAIWIHYLEINNDKADVAKFLDTSFTGICGNEMSVVENVGKDRLKGSSDYSMNGNKIQLLNDMIAYCKDEKSENTWNNSKDQTDCNCLSPLMLSALQLLDDSSEECVLKYVADVLMAVLHQHSSPQVMLDFLSRIFMNVLPRVFKMYMRCVTSSDEDPLKFKPRKCKDVCSVLQYTFACRFQISSCKYDTDTLAIMMEKMIDSSDTFQVCLATKQLLFYIHYILDSENEGKRLAVEAVVYYCSILQELLKNLRKNASTELLLKDVISILFRHPVIKMCFSLDVCTNEDSDTRKAMKEVVRVIIDAAKMYGHGVAEIIKITALGDSIFAFVKGTLKLQAATETDDNFVETFSLSQIASSFLRDQPVKSLVKLVNRVLTTAKAPQASECCGLARLLASLLEILLENPKASNVPVLKEKLVRKCFELCNTANESSSSSMENSTTSLHESLLRLIRTFPFYCTSASDEFFYGCLENSAVVEQHLASTFIMSDLHFHKIFESWCVKRKQNINFQYCIQPVCAYLQMLAVEQERWTDVTSKVLARLVKIYWNESCELVFADQDVEICKLMSLFCHLNCVDSHGKTLVIEKFKRFIKHSSTHTSLQLTQLVYKILADDDDGNCTFVFLAMTLLSKMLKVKDGDVASKVYSDVILFIVKKILDILPSLNKLEAFEDSVKKFDWMKYTKNSLKFALSMDSPQCLEGVLRLLTATLKFLSEYGFSNQPISAAEVHFLLVNHSRFVSEMLDANSSPGNKSALLDLVTFLVQKDPSVCKSSHVCIFLGAYGATLSQTDQKLLRLLCIYEQHGIDMYNFRPFLWGEAAVNRYVSAKTASLWKQPSADEVLNLLDSSNVLLTASKFPVNLPLEPNINMDCDVKSCDETLYDPRFLIPLLNHLFSPECYVPFKVCLSSNVLTLIFGALKSCDIDMRIGAYHIVRNLYEHLEGSKYILRMQILHILDCLKNGITKPHAQISSVVASFLINLIVSLNKPGFHMTKKILAYMHQRPVLKIFEVPNLNGFFFSDDVKQYESRKWILEIMASGLNTMSDFKIYKKNDIIQILLTFCASTLSDTAAKMQVLSILSAAIQIPGVSTYLCNFHCLISFLQGLVQQNIHVAVLPEFVNVVRKLWISLLDDWAKNVQNVKSDLKNVNDDTQVVVSDMKSPILLPKSSYVISKQYHVLLLSMINQNCLRMDCSTLSNYLSTLALTLDFAQKYCSNQHINMQCQLSHSHIKRLLQLYEDSKRTITISEEVQQLDECTKDLIDIFLNWDPSISDGKCDISERATIFSAVLEVSLHTVSDDHGSHVPTVLKVLSWASEYIDFIEGLTDADEISSALFSAILAIFKPNLENGDLTVVQEHYRNCLKAKTIFCKMANFTRLTGSSTLSNNLESWILRITDER